MVDVNPFTPLVGGLPVSVGNPLPTSATVTTAALEALIGALTASAEIDPAAASASLLALTRGVLSRLNTLQGYTDGLEGQLTTLNSLVDGLEALVGSTNTALSTIDGRVDGLETLITTLNGFVDGLEALAAAATPAGSAIIGKVGIDQTAGQNVVTTAQPVTLTDRSGTITAGGTAQNAAAALATRKFLMVHNPDTATDLWFSTTGTAVVTAGAGSTRLGPGSGVLFDLQVPAGAVSVLSATTGKAFVVKEG